MRLLAGYGVINERAARGVMTRPVFLPLFLLLAGLLAAALARQRFFHAFLLARLQIKGVPLDLLDDVLLLHLSLKTAQRVLEGLAFLHADFRQYRYTPKPAQMDLSSYPKLHGYSQVLPENFCISK